MDRLITFGRYVFAIAMAGFGLQHYIYVSSKPGLAPGPPWILGGPFEACAVGGLLVVTGIGIAAAKNVLFPAASLGTTLLVYVLLLYLPGMATHLRDPHRWTRSTEILAMCGGALVLAGSQGEQPRSRPWPSITERFVNVGRLFFAFSLGVFGGQHFIYGRFTATIVPSWIPWRLFWAYFVGLAFIAASMSIATKMLARRAATLLGTMFFLIVILVHVPRVAATPQSGREWTSAFVALAMFGGALIVARACPPRA